MKICFVSLFAYPLFNSKCSVAFGGAEVQLFNLSLELAKQKNNQVDFIVGNFGQISLEIIDNVRLIKSVSPGNRVGLIDKLKSVSKQFKTFIIANADVYVQRSAGIQTGLIAFYCKIFRKKFVYMTAHEWDCNGEYIKNNGFIGKIYKFGLMHADLIVTQSDEYKRKLKKLFNVDSVVLKSGYPIDLNRKISKEDYILWVARLDRWKQPEIFMEIAKKFPKNSFVMIAPESNDKVYSEKIKRQASLISNLKFIPGLSFNKTNEYFYKAKLFVNTSEFEGFPNTFVQAMISATPILSLCVNPDNILNKYKVGFFANKNFQKLVEDMDDILNSKDIYMKMSDNAYTYATNNHDIEILSKEFYTLINKI